MADEVNAGGPPDLAAAVPVGVVEKGTRQIVLEIKRWTDTLFSFKTTRPPAYTFTPGEYSRLGVLFRGETHPSIWRAYSIVSAPHEDFLEYYGVLVTDGLFTTKLKDISPGDPIWIDHQRFGFMTANRFVDGEDLWMLSTGTGLGPYISMLRDPAVWKQFRNLVLVHGVRHRTELSYQEELKAMQASAVPGAARLILVTASTRDGDGGHQDLRAEPTGVEAASDHPIRKHPAGAAGHGATIPAEAGHAGSALDAHLHGRITTLLASGELERAAGLTMNVASSRVMLCGNPEMITETRALLHERGMKPCRRATPGQFVTENYW
ncbi:MAG: ferredoxin--NADP reductase [Janthinobacterium lividum]